MDNASTALVDRIVGAGLAIAADIHPRYTDDLPLAHDLWRFDRLGA
jgi:hypothetical protein